LKASRGSEQYQSMNSRIAWSYDRCELCDVRLSRSADFDCSRSGSFKTDLGLRLCLFFVIPEFCVQAVTSHVNAGLFHGVALLDPDRLLQGTGKFMRHVKLRPGMTTNALALSRLIDTA
jgi:hypothetical protein